MAGLKIKKDDTVRVTSGKYKGQEGKVLRTLPADHKVVVEGVNMVKRHRKPVNQRDPGGIVDVIKPLPTANVMLLCPSCGKSSRVGIEREDGKKMRVCKNCSAKF